MDIIPKPGELGFLADSIDTYVDCIHTILKLDEKDLLKISKKARQFVAKQFSESSFEKGFVQAFN